MISDKTLMSIAMSMADSSTCNRLHVGAVLTKDRRIISTGYNGTPSGMRHCNHKPEVSFPCKQAVHAEANAIVFAAKYGVATGGSVLYTTHSPCLPCAQLIVNAGIKEVIYANTYRIQDGADLLIEAGVLLIKYSG